MKILDCTIRDGGYYTNWDFDKKLVDIYIEACNKLPIDYLEIGYRSNQQDGYLGEFFYLPIFVLEELKQKSNKKLVIILNEKDVLAKDLPGLLKPCIGLIDMVRLAIDPKQFDRAINLAKEVKKMGFEIGFNVMYMSTWKTQNNFIELLPEVNGVADYFYMVDSFGGVFPEDVKEIYNIIKEKINVPIGFHGHNNLELGLINTLTAIECGAEIVDATFTGMGRGAGNLKTELLLIALNAKGKLDFDFNALSKVVDGFTELQKIHEWGTNLPYMFSGANSLPQKQVMEWVSKRFYSFNSIIRALNNHNEGVKDNTKLPVFNFNSEKKYNKVLIVGGGPSVIYHFQAIEKFLKNNSDILIIHASSKNASSFKSLENDQYFCLIGNEGHRLEEVFKHKDINGKCILPPYPRTMGTYIPQSMMDKSYELSEVNFTKKYKDSHTALALQSLIELKIDNVYIIGYDGYSGNKIGEKEQELFMENQELFNLIKTKNIKLNSLTPTKYSELNEDSVYAII